MTSAAASIVGGILAVLIVGGAVVESVLRGPIDAGLAAMATAVVATFFTGQAIRGTNGVKMDALASAVNGVHSRLDQAGIPPAGDGAGPGGPG